MNGRLENFAISEDALRSKLLKKGRSKYKSGEKFSVNNYKASGVEWIGEYPKSVFGIKESDPVEEASEILKTDVQF